MRTFGQASHPSHLNTMFFSLPFLSHANPFSNIFHAFQGLIGKPVFWAFRIRTPMVFSEWTPASSSQLDSRPAPGTDLCTFAPGLHTRGVNDKSGNFFPDWEMVPLYLKEILLNVHLCIIYGERRTRRLSPAGDFPARAITQTVKKLFRNS